MCVLAAALVVAAGWRVHLADEAKEDAARLRAERREVVAQQRRVDDRTSGQIMAAYDIDEIVNDLLASNVASGNAFVSMSDALDEAVARANAGDRAGLHQIADADAGAALEELRAILDDEDELLRALDAASQVTADREASGDSGGQGGGQGGDNDD
jgi:hypothetical protein